MKLMALEFRLARAADHPHIEKMVIDSFEPITWFKKLDTKVGPLNGRDWRTRWQARMRRVFETEIVLVGEQAAQIVAMSSGTLDRADALAYIDLLAVDQRFQGRGYGREMLRGMMRHLQSLGAQYVNLDCLSDNDTANALYAAEGFQEVSRSLRWFRKLPQSS
jgi:ribosomal protein S18 acetylase RimI-like enzyme